MMPRAFLRLTTLACVIVLIAACSLTPDRRALVPATYEIKARYEGSVRVLVHGGDDPNMWEGVNIPDAVFRGAVEDAVNKAGLFASVVQEPGAAFRIEVALQRLSRPTAGAGMDSQLGALWVLRGTDPDQVIWQDYIVTTGHASAGDAFSGITRMRITVERAAQNNIQRALQEMSLDHPRSP